MKAKSILSVPFLVLVCSTGFAAIWAGTPIVDLNGSTIAGASGERSATWTNSVLGSPVGNFITVVGTTSPFVEDYTSPVNQVVTKVLRFDHTEGDANCLSSENNTPAGITGAGDWSVEVWVLNPEVESEETMVAWGRRYGPERANASFNYGTDPVWGAAGHWGEDGDMGYDMGVPIGGTWHHIAWTYDGVMEKVYTDGKLNAQETKTLNINAGRKIRIAGQNDAAGEVEPEWFKGKIAVVRIHDGVLSEGDVIANFENDRDRFGNQPTPVIMVSPGIMDFGQVSGGSGPSSPLVATVVNHTMASANLVFTDDIIILGPFELADPMPSYDPLNPGWDMAFGIAFDPIDDNPACGLAIIRTNDPGGDVHIELLGNQPVVEDGFDTPHDYVADGVAGTIWDGMITTDVTAMDTIDPTSGKLCITAHGNWWNGGPGGAFLYKNVAGDFSATVKADVTTFPYISYEGALLLARVADPGAAGPGEDWVSIWYFPTYTDEGLSYDDGEGTEHFDGAGEKYLRLQRIGNMFSMQNSSDGVVWMDVPGSPVERPDMAGLTLQVGPAVENETEANSNFEFDDFQIVIPQECAFPPTPTPKPPPTPTPQSCCVTGVEDWTLFE